MSYRRQGDDVEVFAVTHAAEAMRAHRHHAELNRNPFCGPTFAGLIVLTTIERFRFVGI
jgi:hypothetical protein